MNEVVGDGIDLLFCNEQEAKLYTGTDDLSQAIDNLNHLLEKYPNDSLASLAQYKLATIYKSWKNDPKNLLEALNKTVNKYPDTPQATQAKKEIQAFQDWIINNSETVLIQKFEESGLEMALHHHWLMMPT